MIDSGMIDGGELCSAEGNVNNKSSRAQASARFEPVHTATVTDVSVRVTG